MSSIPTADRTAGASATTRWRLDPTGSRAEFRVPYLWGLVTIKGHFERLDGRLDVEEGGARRMELTIDAASIHTGIRRRDRHLRSADFLDTEQHPHLRFHSTSITDAGDGVLRVQGELGAAGYRVALDLQPRLEQSDDQLRVDALTVLDQRQLGMTWSPLGMTRPRITVHVHALLQRER